MRSQANGLRPHFSLRQIENILLRKPPSRKFALSALAQRQVKKARHIERKRNIPPKKYGVYTLHFSRGILHYVQNDVFFHPPGRLPQSLRSFAKTVSASEILLLVLYQFEQVTQAVEIVAGEIIYVNSSAIVVAYRRNFCAEIALHALDQIS